MSKRHYETGERTPYPACCTVLCDWCQEAHLHCLTTCPLWAGLTKGCIHAGLLVSATILVECLFCATIVPGRLVSYCILPIKLPCLVPVAKGTVGRMQMGPKHLRKQTRASLRPAAGGSGLSSVAASRFAWIQLLELEPKPRGGQGRVQ